nr:integrin alpha-8-like [Procambarus clarkii]
MQNQGIGFGETLYTTGAAQSKLLACAPRYPRKVVSHDYISLHGRGACYVLSTKAGEVIKVLPYPGDNFQVGQKTYKNTNALTAFALAGSSGVLSQDQHYVYLGGPYAFFGQGILVSMLSSGTKWMETNKATYGAEELDFSMEGWALAVGKFDGAREALATSLPGADHSRGAINFVNARLKPEPGSSVYGQEMGAQFGYCLAAGDVDGDGVDDLIVGAPLAQGRGSQTPDAGKVYIYYGPLVKSAAQKSPLVLAGHLAWGRFGQAVSCPGDLNGDGYEDVVVGAPGGAGRVYVYNGGAEGLHPEHTQILRASDFSPGLRSFGFSLDGSVDMDNNGYPDLIIGAPQSNTAIFVRSAPVVSLVGQVVFDPPVIDLENRSCTIHPPKESPQEVACFELVVELQYESNLIHTPLLMEFDLILDEEQGRLGFMNKSHLRSNVHVFSSSHHVHSTKDTAHPFRVPVFIKRGRYQYHIPGTASVRVGLLPIEGTTYILQDGAEGMGRGSSQATTLPPDVPSVLDFFSQTSFHADVRMDCVDVTTCYSTPDIILHAQAPRHLLVGEEQLQLQVQLEVRNDTAYETKLMVSYPPSVQYVRISGEKHVPSCRLPVRDGKVVITLVCLFSSDLFSGDKIPLTFQFSQSPLSLLTQGHDSGLTFHLNVTSSSKDLNEADNALDLTVLKVSLVNLLVDGSSDPDTVEGRVNETLSLDMLSDPDALAAASAEMLGPHTKHSFAISNVGPTPLLGAKMTLQVPTHMPNGLPLLYLVEALRTSGPVVCHTPPLNTLNLTSHKERERENFEEIEDKEEEKSLAPNTARTENLKADNPEAADSARNPAAGEASRAPAGEGQTTARTEETRPSRRRRLAGNSRLASPDGSYDQDSAALTAFPHPSDDNKRTRTLTSLDCREIKCQEITCEVSNLLAGNTVKVDVSGFITVATIKRLKTRSITLESSMTFETTQPCVSVNDQPLSSWSHDHHATTCGGTAGDLHPEVSTDDVDDQGTTDVDDQGTTDVDDQLTTDVDDQGTTDVDDQVTKDVDDQVTTDDSTTLNETTTEQETESLLTRNPEDHNTPTQHDVNLTENDNKNDSRDVEKALENGTTNAQDDTNSSANDKSKVVNTTKSDAIVPEDGGNDPPKDGGDDRVPYKGFVIKATTHVALIEWAEGRSGLESLKDLGFWTLFLTVIGAVMLIIIISSILYKVGFFKRKQRLTSEQREALKKSQERNNRVKMYQDSSVVDTGGGVVMVG